MSLFARCYLVWHCNAQQIVLNHFKWTQNFYLFIERFIPVTLYIQMCIIKFYVVYVCCVLWDGQDVLACRVSTVTAGAGAGALRRLEECR